MTPQPAWCKTASTCTVSGRFSQELHHHGGGNTICPADFELLSRKLCQNDVACSDVVCTTKVFILNKEDSLLTSLGRHYSFRTSATFLFLLSLFSRDNFFCRWRVVQCPRQQMYVDSCTTLPPMHNGAKPFWNHIFSFIICIRFDKWSVTFTFHLVGRGGNARHGA